MEKKVFNAFTFMFKDKDWMFQLTILILMTIPSIYQSYLTEISGIKTPTNILLYIITLTTGTIISGYFSKCTQNVIFSKAGNTNLLPKWEDGVMDLFVIGMKKFVATILITIALIPGSLLIIPLLIFGYICIALERVFCTQFKMGAYFAWKEAIDLIKQAPGKYVQILLAPLLLLIPILIIAGIAIASKSMIMITLVPIAGCYTALVAAYLSGIVGDGENENFIDDYGYTLN